MFFEYLYVFVFLYLLFNVFMTRREKWFMFNPIGYSKRMSDEYSVDLLKDICKKYGLNPYKNVGVEINKYVWVNTWSFQWHHLYTGIILMEIGVYCFCNLDGLWKLVGFIALVFGAFLVADDIYQHREQRKRNNPNFHTFGHKIGRPFYHLRRWLIKVTGWEWLNKF